MMRPTPLYCTRQDRTESIGNGTQIDKVNETSWTLPHPIPGGFCERGEARTGFHDRAKHWGAGEKDWINVCRLEMDRNSIMPGCHMGTGNGAAKPSVGLHLQPDKVMGCGLPSLQWGIASSRAMPHKTLHRPSDEFPVPITDRNCPVGRVLPQHGKWTGRSSEKVISLFLPAINAELTAYSREVLYVGPPQKPWLLGVIYLVRSLFETRG